MSSRFHLVLLAVIVLLAGAARFIGIGHGLRHDPVADEAYFVEAARQMWAAGDLDHRYHEYPSLPVYVIVPAVAAAGDDRAASYVAARGIVAALGTLSVLLAFVLGRRVAGPVAGLYAAAALAVSSVDVRVAHEVRPDVLLGTAAVGALLVFTGTRTGPWADVASGLAVGVGTAVKFSGALLGPVWAAGLPFRGRAAVAAAARALGASLLTFAALSPYSLIRTDALREGVDTQLDYHYGPKGPWWDSVGTGVAAYVDTWVESFSWAGALLAGAGAVLLLRRDDRARFVTIAVLPVAAVALYATSGVHRDRFMLVTTGAMAVLSGVTVASAASRSRIAAGGLALAALVPSAARSADVVSAFRQPVPADAALAWLEANVPPGRRVLTTVRTLGLDAARWELRRVFPRQLTPRLALESDLLVIFEGERTDWRQQLETVARFEPRTAFSGLPIVVLRVPAALQPVYGGVGLPDGSVRASTPQGVEDLHDADPATAWSSSASQAGREWIEVHLPSPTRVGRVVLEQGTLVGNHPRRLELEASTDGTRFAPIRFEMGRPSVPEQPDTSPRGEVLLLDEADVVALRIRQVGHRPRPWSVAEVKVDELLGAPEWAALKARRR